MAKTRLQKRVEFAPYAEALKVTTDSVLSVQSDDGSDLLTVLYTETPTRAPDAILYRAVLYANPEGILQVVENRPLCTLGRFAAQVKLIMGGIREPLPETPKANFEGFDFDTGFDVSH